jgi:YVTN family beta-propeller protein
MGEVFVANHDPSGTVSVISDSTNKIVINVSVGGDPYGLAYDSGKGQVFVVNSGVSGSGSVSIISDSTNTVVKTVPVGTYPDDAAYDSATGEIYVTNSGSDNVMAISDSSQAVVHTIGVGNGPQGIAYDSALGEIFVANGASNNVTVISDASNTVVANIAVGTSPQTVVYDSGLDQVYTANTGSKNVSTISDASNTVVDTTPVGLNPWGVGYDSSRSEMFVTNSGSNNVSVVPVGSIAVVANIPVGSGPSGLTYDPDNGDIYVSNELVSPYTTVSVISGTLSKVIATITAGNSANYPPAFDSSNGDLYEVNTGQTGGWNVSVISGSSNQVVATLPVGGNNPLGATYVPANGDIYVPHGNGSVLTGWLNVIDGATNTVVGHISQPYADQDQVAVYDPANGDLYVSNGGSGPAGTSVEVISTATNALVATVGVGSVPSPPAYDPANGDIYVPNCNTNNVTVISGVTNSVVANISTVACPDTPTYNPSNGDLYVPSYGYSSVAVISGATNKVVKTIGVGSDPWPYITYAPADGDMYVSNDGSHNVSVISGFSNSVVANIGVGSSPTRATYDPANHNIYLVNMASDNVSVIATSLLRPAISDFKVSPSSIGLGENTTFSVSLSNGVAPFNYTYSNLPAGCSPAGGPSFGCTPSSEGVYTVEVAVTGTNHMVAFANVTLSVGGSISSVTVSPQTASVETGGKQTFTATPTCAAACPAGIAYSWSTTKTAMGALNTTIGESVSFTAASIEGQVGVFVNATLSGTTVQSEAAIITVTGPALSSVSISPTSATVPEGATVSFDAIVTCTGTCPSGITYSWMQTKLMGTVDDPSAREINFTAGDAIGTVGLFLNATHSGVTVMSAPTIITITVPVLTSVTISPAPSTVPSGGSSSYFATKPVCTGTCPSDVTYAWSLSHALGALNRTSGNTVTFTSGSSTGTVGLFVNATLNGVTKESPADVITITAGSSSLVSVSVNPTSGYVQVGKSITFAATVGCTSNPCPTGLTYDWSLNNTLGTLGTTTDESTTFTAGQSSGVVGLTVTASLNGYSRSTAVTVQVLTQVVPVLSSVGLNFASVTVPLGGWIRFTAAPQCSQSSCVDSDIGYAWSLSTNLGLLNSTSTQSVNFTAGNTSGTLKLEVIASFNGVSVFANATITIENAPAATPFLSGIDVVIMIVVALVVIVALGLLMRKKRPSAPPHATEATTDAQVLATAPPGQPGTTSPAVESGILPPTAPSAPTPVSPAAAHARSEAPAASSEVDTSQSVASTPEPRKYCPKCGTPNSSNAVNCVGCGSRIVTRK